MAVSSGPGAVRLPAVGMSVLIETVRAAAIEVRSREPDQAQVEAARLALLEIRRRSGAVHPPLAEIAEIVLQALELACRPEASRQGNPGFYVEAAAADLNRLALAIARGEEPTPLLDHARAMLLATRQTMPRVASQPQTTHAPMTPVAVGAQPPQTREVIEIDLSDREQVERLLAAAGTTSPLAELRACLGVFGAEVDSLRQAPHGAGVPLALLDSVAAVRTRAETAGEPGLRRIFRSVVALLGEYRQASVPLSPDALELLIAARRVAPLLLDGDQDAEHATQLVKSLSMQADALLRELRSSRETHDFWPEREPNADADAPAAPPQEIETRKSEQVSPPAQRGGNAQSAIARPSTLLEAMRLLEPASAGRKRIAAIANGAQMPPVVATSDADPKTAGLTVSSSPPVASDARVIDGVETSASRAEGNEGRNRRAESVIEELGSLQVRLIALVASLEANTERDGRVEPVRHWENNDEARAVAAALKELASDTQLAREELTRLLRETTNAPAGGESYALRAALLGGAENPRSQSSGEVTDQAAGRIALVIDDSPSARLSLSRALGAVGWTVLEARDVSQARAALASARPDVVLIDVTLAPLAAIVAAAPQIPIIGLLPHDGDQAHVPGVTAYLTKPIDPSPLLRTLDQMSHRER